MGHLCTQHAGGEGQNCQQSKNSLPMALISSWRMYAKSEEGGSRWGEGTGKVLTFFLFLPFFFPSFFLFLLFLQSHHNLPMHCVNVTYRADHYHCIRASMKTDPRWEALARKTLPGMEEEGEEE